MNLSLAESMFRTTYGSIDVLVENVPQLNFLLKDNDERNILKNKLCTIKGGFFYLDEDTNNSFSTNIDLSSKSDLQVFSGKVTSELSESEVLYKIPSFISSIYNVNKDFWSDLQKNHRNRTIYSYRKDLDFFNKNCNSFIVPLSNDLLQNKSSLNIFDELHLENIKKYNHSSNPWNTAVLNELIETENFYVYIVSTRDDIVLRAVLVEINDFNKTAKTLVQGQRENSIFGKNFSLYRVSTIDLIIKLTDIFNMKKVWFGRGMPFEKYRTGANEFEIINTLTFTEDTTLHDLLRKSKETNERKIKNQLQDLTDSFLFSRFFL